MHHHKQHHHCWANSTPCGQIEQVYYQVNILKRFQFSSKHFLKLFSSSQLIAADWPCHGHLWPNPSQEWVSSPGLYSAVAIPGMWWSITLTKLSHNMAYLAISYHAIVKYPKLEVFNDMLLWGVHVTDSIGWEIFYIRGLVDCSWVSMTGYSIQHGIPLICHIEFGGKSFIHIGVCKIRYGTARYPTHHMPTRLGKRPEADCDRGLTWHLVQPTKPKLLLVFSDPEN